MTKEALRARLMATFGAEAREHLAAIARNLESLARGPSAGESGPVVEETFRAMHTLKGAARSVGLTEVEALCHECESILSSAARGTEALTGTMVSGLQTAVAGIGRLVGVAGDAPASSGQQATARAPVAAADTIRVPTESLDALLVQAEELLVPRLAAGERARQARELVATVAACRGENGRASVGATDCAAALRVAESQAGELLAGLVSDQRLLAATLDGLDAEARALRMSPASSVLDLFMPMVWDLAGAQGKEAELTVRGADLPMDRKVLEAMKDPLIHLLRNAVDHGIEPPEERVRAGKPRRGRIEVTLAARDSGSVEVRVEDDGRGLDLARVKAAAVRSRLLTAEQAESLTDDAALELACRSGVSTSPRVTAVSGHGLGLAIVREKAERLGGRVRLETRDGHGTAVSMTLPTTVATFRGLLVAAAGQLFLLPIEATERAIRVAAEDVRPIEGRDTILWNEEPVWLAELPALLGLPGSAAAGEAASRRPCVVVRVGDARVALVVDAVLGERQVLVKELAPPLRRVRHVAAAGLLATGELAFILRPLDLLRAARGAQARGAPPSEPTATTVSILVVDDSITTRTMERNLLEAAGYRVRVAVDGVEAWTALKTESFGLVVSDVDMPRMDGFELTRRIRADRQLAELPVVLVTALESREDKERGIEAGANAYVIKSTFQESDLLETIRRLA